MTKTYIGYCAKDHLPIKAGDRVRIKKGIQVRSMHPAQKGVRAIGRTYTVMVDHVLSGRSIHIAEQFPDGELAFTGPGHREMDSYCRRFGIKVRPQLGGDPEAWKKLLDLPQCQIRDMERDGWKEVYLHLDPPSVRWPGSSGYWMEADINDVEKIDD